MPSIFGDILTATKTRLEAIAGIPTVKIRKKPVLVQEDTIPLVLVTPGRERIGMEAFDTVVEYIYEVQVTVIRAGNRIYESDVQSFLELRQRLAIETGMGLLEIRLIIRSGLPTEDEKASKIPQCHLAH